MRLPIPQSVRFARMAGSSNAATHRPVPLPSLAATLPLLCDPSRWPDFDCAGGRFAPLCSRW